VFQICGATARKSRTIMHSPSTWLWHDHCRCGQLNKAGNGRRRRRPVGLYTDITEIGHGYSRITVSLVCYQRKFEDDARRNGQPVKCVLQCWHDVVVPLDASDEALPAKSPNDRIGDLVSRTALHYAQYTPPTPTRRNCFVASAVRTQFATRS